MNIVKEPAPQLWSYKQGDGLRLTNNKLPEGGNMRETCQREMMHKIHILFYVIDIIHNRLENMNICSLHEHVRVEQEYI